MYFMLIMGMRIHHQPIFNFSLMLHKLIYFHPFPKCSKIAKILYFSYSLY